MRRLGSLRPLSTKALAKRPSVAQAARSPRLSFLAIARPAPGLRRPCGSTVGVCVVAGRPSLPMPFPSPAAGYAALRRLRQTATAHGDPLFDVTRTSPVAAWPLSPDGRTGCPAEHDQEPHHQAAGDRAASFDAGVFAVTRCAVTRAAGDVHPQVRTVPPQRPRGCLA